MNRIWPIILVTALVAACQTTTATRRDTPWLPPAEAARSDADRLLEFHERVLRLRGPNLAREYERARLDFENHASDLHRVQLALILSIPGTGFRDEAAAIGLLQPVLKEQRTESNLRPLALLLQSHLLEMRRADDALQAQSAKLREEQRRAEALQQKLEALLEMEMKMIEREQTGQPRRR